jgi:acetyl esterase/lipase
LRGHRRLGVLLVAVLCCAGCGDGSGSTNDAAPTIAATTTTTAPPLVACGASATFPYSAHDGFDADLNRLDVYMPPADEHGCTDRALVVWVHGGGWHEGDKTDHITDKVRLFNDAGYVFASVNYRLTDITRDPPTPQYPVHDQDTADALAWIVDHAGQLGVDPRRIAMLGHSAGGGIVAAITTDDQYLRLHGLGIDAVRCAGSIDGEGYDVVVGATHPDPFVRDAYYDAFGTDPAVWEVASPMTHIAPGKGIPDYFVAARGPEVRLELHLEFAEALRAANVPTTVLDARDLDHGTVSTDIGAPGDTVVTPAVMTFLQGCFTTPP